MLYFSTSISVEDPESKGGLSKDKCALAMSFFANDAPKKPAAKKPVPTKTEQTSSDDGLPAVQNSTARPFMKERAYYEPEQESNPEDDEDDVIPDFQARRRAAQRQISENSSDETPPRVPVRSVNSDNSRQGMMLRLMKNATNIMRS